MPAPVTLAAVPGVSKGASASHSAEMQGARWQLVTVLPVGKTFLFQVKPLCLVRAAHARSLRAQYGSEAPFNAVHGSRDAEAARRELALLFPGFTFADHVPEASPGKPSRQARVLSIVSEYTGGGMEEVWGGGRIVTTR